MKSQVIATLVALASTAAAHGGVCHYTVDGAEYNGYQPPFIII
jgi:hypothetical protein